MKLYEKASDRAREAWAMKVVADAWNCHSFPFAVGSPTDFELYRRNRVKVVAEHKGRKCTIERWPTTWFAVAKVKALRNAVEHWRLHGRKVKGIGIITWLHDEIRWMDIEDIVQYPIGKAKNNRMKTKTDIEPAHFIPPEDMHTVKWRPDW